MTKLLDFNFTKTESKALKSNKIRQIVDFINEEYDIRVNRFKNSEKEIVSKNKKYHFPISLDDISLHLQENEISVSDSILRKIINSPNQIRTYNPIREYFDSLEGTYQGISHIDKLCMLMEAKDYGDKEEIGYYQIRLIKVLKKWLVASVACSLEVFQNEVALGLIQEEEGTGKTSICQMLCPPPLKMMFIRSDKEKNGFNMRTAFTENFIVLFDEMIGLSHFTAETFKSTMSAIDIDVKERHDPFPHRKRRIANAMFTTNNKTGRNKGFLFPSLGTRRFACLHLENIDYDTILADVDINQVWAEAYLLFKNGFDYQFRPADFKDFLDYNQRFMIETNAVQLIEANFCKPVNSHDGQWLQAIDIMTMLKDARMASRDTLAELSPEKIGVALKQLGYQKHAKRMSGDVKYPYYIKPLFTV
jgi:predicted P-loop ATPase